MTAQEIVEAYARRDEELGTVAARIEAQAPVAPARRNQAQRVNALEARRAQFVGHAEVVQNADRTGRDAVAAHLVARKLRAIEHEYVAPAAREHHGRGTARGTGSDHDDIA